MRVPANRLRGRAGGGDNLYPSAARASATRIAGLDEAIGTREIDRAEQEGVVCPDGRSPRYRRQVCAS